MAVINVSQSTTEATVVIGDAGANLAAAANTITLANLQDITVTNNQGSFRYQTLDSQSEAVVLTVATNSIGLNLVVDETQFFGDGADASPIINKGLFGTSNDKTSIDFRVYFEGTSVSGNKYIEGSGFITGLAPTVNPGAPLWVTPVTIEVNGDLTEGDVTA